MSESMKERREPILIGGDTPSLRIEECQRCNGYGKIRPLREPHPITCPDCHGSGKPPLVGNPDFGPASQEDRRNPYSPECLSETEQRMKLAQGEERDD